MSDPLAYPDQDPAELRATIVRDMTGRVRRALTRAEAADAQYTSAAIKGNTADRTVWRVRRQQAWDTVRGRLDQLEHWTLAALEEAQVPAIHDNEVT